MKVLLNQDIDRVGRMGEVVEVAGGFARNYLIPRGLAEGVTRGRMKEIEERRKVLEIKAARQREQLEELAGKVRSKRIAVKARCSATGKLFGSITNRQLAAEIAAQTGEEIDRHKISIDDRIRSVGTYHAIVKLHPDVEIDVEFDVEGEGFVTEEPADIDGGALEAVSKDAPAGDAPAAAAEAGADAGDEQGPAEAADEEAGEAAVEDEAAE